MEVLGRLRTHFFSLLKSAGRVVLEKNVSECLTKWAALSARRCRCDNVEPTERRAGHHKLVAVEEPSSNKDPDERIAFLGRHERRRRARRRHLKSAVPRAPRAAGRPVRPRPRGHGSAATAQRPPPGL